MFDNRFCLKLHKAVHKSYVRPTTLYESEVWCLKEKELYFIKCFP